MTYSLAGQTITAPDTGGHGLDMRNGQDWLVEDCLIDLSACPLGQLDEAVGVVWGSSAVFHCWAHSSMLLGKEETKLGK